MHCPESQRSEFHSDPTGDEMAPLHLAALWGSPEEFAACLERGDDLEARDTRGRTPLLILCGEATPFGGSRKFPTDLRRCQTLPHLSPHLQKIGLALLWQADVNALGVDGDAPLHAAARRCAPDVVQLLLCANADPGIRNLRRYTPLHAAADHGATRCAELLIEAGASIDAVDHYGFTPLHGACFRGHADVALRLLHHGADPNRPIRRDFGAARKGMIAFELACAVEGAPMPELMDALGVSPAHIRCG